MVYNLSEKFFLMLVYSLILFGYKQKMVFIILSHFQFIKSLALEPTPHCLCDYHMCSSPEVDVCSVVSVTYTCHSGQLG